MLEATSVAIVGASARPGSFGARMLAEARRSSAKPQIYPVNPRYPAIDGLTCYPSLAELPAPADLVLLGVPDAALEEQLGLAAGTGVRSAVIFGNAVAPGLRERLAAVACGAGMELCGAGCMGFANVSYGLRAMGYVEPDPLPGGPVALVTHSGSVFSALLRTQRGFGFTLAVSSGQELVTAAPSYLSYALDQPQTSVLALVLEAIRKPDDLRAQLARAAERDVPVILLTAGSSARGQDMVAAHSGALAGTDAGWEALTRAYGLHRVGDLAELADTLELFALKTRRRPGPAGAGIATVHDSGLERAHTADLAEQLSVPFGAISDTTMARLSGLLDSGLVPTNPLDVWGTGANTRQLFADALTALADDESVGAVALAVDLVTELDGDDAYQQAVLDASGRTDKPLAVLSNLGSAIDAAAAARLRSGGIPVLEGTRSGLLAMRHLLDWLGQRTARPARTPVRAAADRARIARARGLLDDPFALLREYGIATARIERVSSAADALAAAERIGYPVVLKTDQPGVAHKTEVRGVVLGLADERQLASAYADLARRLGPAVLVCETIPPGAELALGITRDPALGPLVVVGAGGVLVELIADRAVALPPLSVAQASGLLDGLRIGKLLAGLRGGPPADLTAVAGAIGAVSELAVDLADQIAALDINPLICLPDRAVAADALVVRR